MTRILSNQFVPTMIGISRYKNTNCTFTGDLALSITLINGDIGNFNIDMSIVNQFKKSNCSKPIDSILKAREELEESHYRQVVNHPRFDRLIPFGVSTSGALGNKGRFFFGYSYFQA